MTRWFVLAACLSTTIARADDATVTCKEAAPNTQITATFKPEVSLQDLVTWVASFTCKNIVIAPDVAKRATKLTIATRKPMTPKQAVQLFVDAVESTGLVVTLKPDTIVIKLGPNMPKNCPDLAAKAPAPPPVAPADDLDAPYPDEIAKPMAAIKKLGETNYEVPRALVDAILANPMAATKKVRVVPAIKNGKPEGMKLYAIRPDSLLAKIGLLNGDTLETVNGTRLDSAETALEVYAKLKGQTRIAIGLVRRAKPVTLVITVK